MCLATTLKSLKDQRKGGKLHRDLYSLTDPSSGDPHSFLLSFICIFEVEIKMNII